MDSYSHLNSESSSDGLYNSRGAALLLALDVLQVEVLSISDEEDRTTARNHRSIFQIEKLLLGDQDSRSLRTADELVAGKVDGVLLAKPIGVVNDLWTKNIFGARCYSLNGESKIYLLLMSPILYRGT